MKTFMKKMNLFWSIVMVIFAFAACSTGDWYDDALESDDDNSKSTSTADNVVTGVSSDGDVTSFTVALNKNAISESVKVDSSDDDYIENTSFGKTITITFSTSGAATVSGDEELPPTIPRTSSDMYLQERPMMVSSSSTVRRNRPSCSIASVSPTLMALPSTTKVRSAPSLSLTTVRKTT